MVIAVIQRQNEAVLSHFLPQFCHNLLRHFSVIGTAGVIYTDDSNGTVSSLQQAVFILQHHSAPALQLLQAGFQILPLPLVVSRDIIDRRQGAQAADQRF